MAIQSASKNKGKSDKAADKAVPAAKAAPAAKSTAKSVAAAPKARSSYEPSQQEIQARAFEIYLSEGCKEGSDLENWLRAEKELRDQGPR